MEIFTRQLPDSLYALAADPSPRNQIRASVTYNHIVEGTLALTGYFTWAKVLLEPRDPARHAAGHQAHR